jgi:uncharacterized membrane protein (DUF2068 family)
MAAHSAEADGGGLRRQAGQLSERECRGKPPGKLIRKQSIINPVMARLESLSAQEHKQRKAKHSPAIIWTIASFKIFKGLILLAAGIGALTLLNEDVADQVRHWIAALRVDPDNHYIHALLIKLTRVDNHKLEEISAGSFFYSGLLLTEGIGLFLQKRWAEYFTIFVTGSLIPLEIYELAKHFSVTKIVVLVVNAAIVVYLIIRVAQKDNNNG